MLQKLKIPLLFGALLLLSACSTVALDEPKMEVVNVEFLSDSSEADFVIKATYNDCSATIEINDSSSNDTKYVKAQPITCESAQLSHSEIRSIQHKQLETLFEKFEIGSLSSIQWPMMYDESHSWIFPIAMASVESEEYADYRKNYPNAQNNSIHAIFAQLAEETNAYGYTGELFREFGVEIKLGSTEKMGAAPVSNVSPLDLKEQLIEAGLSEDQRVITGPAIAYFKLHPNPIPNISFDKIDWVDPVVECNTNKTQCKVLNLELPEGAEGIPEDSFYDEEGNLFLSFWQEDHFDFYKNDELIVSVPIYFGTSGPIWNLGLIDGALTFEYSAKKDEKMVMNLYYQGEFMNEKFNMDSSKELFIYKEKIGFVAKKDDDTFIWFNGQSVSENFEAIRTQTCCMIPAHVFELYDDGRLLFEGIQGGEARLSEVDLNSFL